jgi:hypothetical protein
MTGMITWHERKRDGVGVLTLDWADGVVETTEVADDFDLRDSDWVINRFPSVYPGNTEGNVAGADGTLHVVSHDH